MIYLDYSREGKFTAHGGCQPLVLWDNLAKTGYNFGKRCTRKNKSCCGTQSVSSPSKSIMIVGSDVTDAILQENGLPTSYNFTSGLYEYKVSDLHVFDYTKTTTNFNFSMSGTCNRWFGFGYSYFSYDSSSGDYIHKNSVLLAEQEESGRGQHGVSIGAGISYASLKTMLYGTAGENSLNIITINFFDEGPC